MSIRSMVNDYLDKIVDGRFKRDAQRRLVFFPWGFGAGRLVPDAAVEAQLRRASRGLMIGIFVVAIPAISAFNGFYHLTGWAFLAYFLVASAMGFGCQLYLAWLSRHLPHAEERMSYSTATMQSLNHFGRKYLIFGLATSLLFTFTAALMLVLPSDDAIADQAVMAICLLVFAPLAVVYAIALWRHQNGGASSA